ncbi:MAG: glutamine synthetase type III, partial [Lachnospiraceae bacterium]|nr:glutamine synthetase type III [Candidatus Colinaster scatohippi]
GKTPAENVQFLVFLAAVIKAVDDYADMMRFAVASAGNDHRLGANEAPPAIISMFLGDELAAVVDSIEKGTLFEGSAREAMDIGATVLPHFFKDTTDRNRTSPFAFTGNKFEFRSLGSSLSVAGPNVVLNTAVAESLSQFYDELKDAADLDLAVKELIKKTITEHKRVIFNGDGYTDEWVAEAEKRGLYNLKTTPDVLPKFTDEKNVTLFTKHGVFTKSEIDSRYEILLENYVKTLHIEAKTLSDMLYHEFLPAVLVYTDDLATSIVTRKEAVAGISCKTLEDKLTKVSASYDELSALTEKLVADTAKVEGIEDMLEAALFYKDTIIPDMEAIRTVADATELIMPADVLPYPTYADMLFYV